MNTDDFERHLQRQSLRAPPAEWRDQILAAARRELEHRSVPGFGGARLRRAWFRQFRDWLWPHPIAWGALAACWTAVLVLNWAAGVPPLASVRLTPSGTAAMAIYSEMADIGGRVAAAKSLSSGDPSSSKNHPPTSSLIRRHETEAA